MIRSALTRRSFRRVPLTRPGRRRHGPKSSTASQAEKGAGTDEEWDEIEGVSRREIRENGGINHPAYYTSGSVVTDMADLIVFTFACQFWQLVADGGHRYY